MTYLPGSDDAIYPGEITVDLVVDDESANVVMDTSERLYPLDGLLPQLARTLADVGLLDEFCVLARNTNLDRRMQAIDALRSEKRIGQVHQHTLTIDQARSLGEELLAVAVEPEPCSWPGCVNYRVEGEHCPAHMVDAYDDYDPAWGAA